ncbi:MAG: hypothetical protein ACYS7Y_36105, partial [Planctomycetota bacterium]
GSSVNLIKTNTDDEVEVGDTSNDMQLNASAIIDANGRVDVDGLLLEDGSELTISSGAVNVTKARHTIDTESDASTDDLGTINGLAAGEVCLLSAANDARTVVIKHDDNNVFTSTQDDIFLDTNKRVVIAIGLAGSEVYVIADDHSAVGEMYEDNDSGSGITITTSGTYYGWVTASTGEVRGVTFASDATADKLTVAHSGLYHVDGAVSFTGSIGSTFLGVVHVNGSPQVKVKFRRKIGTGGDIGSASLSGVLDLSENDYVDLRFTADGNNKTITIYSANLSIAKG